MAKTPGVIVEKSGGQVRLRGLKYNLPVSLDIEGRGRISVLIEPNRWTKVPDEVYAFLKGRFDSGPRYTAVLDVEESERNPTKPGQAPHMTKEEVDPQFYLEFRG